MGDRNVLRSFDLPRRLGAMLEAPYDWDTPENLVAQLVTPVDPTCYPHFEGSLHNEDAERGRCVAFREFIHSRVRDTLYNQCGALSQDGEFPLFLIISATLDVVGAVSLKDYAEISRRVFAALSPDDDTERMYGDTLEKLAGLKRTAVSKKKLEKFLFGDGKVSKIADRLLIEPIAVPKSRLSEVGFWWGIQFHYWCKCQLDWAVLTLATVDFPERKIIENGSLARELLPSKLRTKLPKTGKRKDKRHDNMRKTHDKIIEDYLKRQVGQNSIGIKEYIRKYLDLLLDQLYSGGNHQLRRPTLKTVTRWLGKGEIEKWKEKRA